MSLMRTLNNLMNMFVFNIFGGGSHTSFGGNTSGSRDPGHIDTDTDAPQEGTMTEGGVPGATRAGGSTRGWFSHPHGPSGGGGGTKPDDTIGHGATPGDLDAAQQAAARKAGFAQMTAASLAAAKEGVEAVPKWHPPMAAAPEGAVVVSSEPGGQVATFFVPLPTDGTEEVEIKPLVGRDGGVCAGDQSHRFGQEIDVPGGVGGEFNRRVDGL